MHFIKNLLAAIEFMLSMFHTISKVPAMLRDAAFFVAKSCRAQVCDATTDAIKNKSRSHTSFTHIPMSKFYTLLNSKRNLYIYTS